MFRSAKKDDVCNRVVVNVPKTVYCWGLNEISGFARKCMKCTYLHRKVIFVNGHPQERWRNTD